VGSTIMGLGGAYSIAMRTLSPEQLDLMAANRKLVNQLNDQKAKHEAELATLRQEMAAARVATADLQALNASWHRQLRDRDAALQDLQAGHERLRAENADLRRRLQACDNVNRLIAEVARGETSVLTRGSR
jgi:chromosome segregation ATPase